MDRLPNPRPGLLAALCVALLTSALWAQDGMTRVPRSKSLPTEIEEELLQDLRVEERNHRMRLGKLRRLYLLASEQGWTERAEEVSALAGLEQERHASARAAIRVKVRPDLFQDTEAKLAKGRGRSTHDRLPDAFAPTGAIANTAARVPQQERSLTSVQRQKQIRAERLRAQREELRRRALRKRNQDRLNESRRTVLGQSQKKRAPQGESTTRMKKVQVQKKPKGQKP